jgi:hypothetical protein
VTPTKKSLKKEILEEITEKLMEDEFLEDTRHGEPECIRCTQEISRHQK